MALTATTRRRNGKTETGFSVRVAGGLSTEPHLAVRLNAFVLPQQAAQVVRGIAEIFRESEVLRQSRERARLKFLFLNHGWTAESFLSELHQRIGFTLDPAEPEQIPEDAYRDHVGVHAQKQPGYSYVGASVLRGRISADQLKSAAELAHHFADGEIRTTIMQNLVLVNVRNENAAAVAGGLEAAGLPVAASVFARGTIACTGSGVLQTRAYRN